MATKTKQDIYNSSPASRNGVSYEDWLKGSMKLPYTDDDYLSEIEQYKDKPWYSQLLNNPWLAGNQQPFSPTFWQQIASVFGDDSSEDRYYAELQSNRSQWLSEFLEKMRQQDYDSPLQQVQRDIEAGLNPDLVGNISSGAAAENDQPMQGVNMHMPGQSDGSSIANFGINLLSNIMGMAQSFQSIKAGKLAMNAQELNNIGKEISNENDGVNFVVKQIAGLSHFRDVDDIDKLTPEELSLKLIDASNKVDYSRYSPKTRRIIKSWFGQYHRDVRSGKYPLAVEQLRSSLRAQVAANNQSAVSSASNPYYSEDFDEFLKKYSQIIGKAEFDSYMASLKSSRSKSDYDTKYFHELDPSKQAKAANDEASSRSVMARQQSISEGLYTDLYELFKNSDSWYGYAGLLALPLVRGLLQNMSFGVGRYGKNGQNFGFTGINF